MAVCAADGAEGLPLLRAGAPDAIVPAVTMPKVDGVSLVPAPTSKRREEPRRPGRE